MSSTTATHGPVKEFYVHDLVYKFDDRKRITFGIVSESYESDSDDVQKGQIVVSWNNAANRKQICRQSKVHLMSRSVIPGDVVRRLEDGKETQRGYCRRTRQTATVQIVESDKVVEHVADHRLCFIRPFEIGDAVCLGEKFGRVQSVDYMMKLKSKCGSLVEIRSSINYHVRDYWNTSYGRSMIGYPGQTVICTPLHLKDPKWIRKSKTMKRKMEIGQLFTIQSVETCLVEVWWYNPSGQTDYAELKEDEIKGLKVVPFAYHLIIFDRHVMKIKLDDIVLNKRDWIKKKSIQHMPRVPEAQPTIAPGDRQTADKADLVKSPPLLNGEIEDDWLTEDDDDDDDDAAAAAETNELGGLSSYFTGKMNLKRRSRHPAPKLNKFFPGSVVAVEVLCTDSTVTVVWQDGTEERDVPTTELYYSVSLDDHEFFPGEWVVPSEASGDAVDQYGVVQRVNFQERTAEVKWFSACKPGDKPTELSCAELSVYDLSKHPSYIFRPGCVVRANPIQNDKMGKVIDSCPQGHVMVQWLGGEVQDCWPQDLELIPESEDFEFPDDFDSDDDFSDDAYSWETESVESVDDDLNEEVNLERLASKVEFVRSRLAYLRDVFQKHNINQNFHFIKDLLSVYDNSSYLDKYLGTSLFSPDSKHFQALLKETVKKAKAVGVELRGRIFSRSTLGNFSTHKTAEKDNIQKMLNLESKVNAQIESGKECSAGESCPPTPESPDKPAPTLKPNDNLCIELLLMLKMRMDLVYAEIVSRMGSNQALTVLSSTTSEIPTKSKLPPLTSSCRSLVAQDDEQPTPQSVSLSNHQPSLAVTTPPPAQKVESLVRVSPKPEHAFDIIDEAPDTHHYYTTNWEAKDHQKFLVALQKEYKLMRESLPPGVWVRFFEDRTDLLSVMIKGPSKTPYEGGLFLFDIQLSNDYPKSPPLVHYISYTSEALNPNLYVEGKVCVSLLGTWMGRGSEVWSSNSTLLQLIVSIQGLILVAEPYYNEAGYERHTHTQQGHENSRTYNEFVLLKLVQSMTELLGSQPRVFQGEILDHFRKHGEEMCERLLGFCDEHREEGLKPDFPLLPVSRGLKLSLRGALKGFKTVLHKALLSSSSGND